MVDAWEFLRSIFVGVTANAIFVLLTACLGVLIYRLVRRRSLLRFFGIADDRRLRIYISQLDILGDRAGRMNGLPGFHGSAVGFLESTEARRIAELFLFLIPGLSGLPTLLSRLFVADVSVEIEPAAFAPAEPRLDCSYISLGTPLFNTASGFTESRVRRDLGFRGTDNAELHIPGLQPMLKATNPWYAVLGRFTFSDVKIFYAAGFHDVGTAAAAFYLRRHWRRLHNRFGDSDFFVVLTIASADYRSATVVAENTL